MLDQISKLKMKISKVSLLLVMGPERTLACTSLSLKMKMEQMKLKVYKNLVSNLFTFF